MSKLDRVLKLNDEIEKGYQALEPAAPSCPVCEGMCCGIGTAGDVTEEARELSDRDPLWLAEEIITLRRQLALARKPA